MLGFGLGLMRGIKKMYSFVANIFRYADASGNKYVDESGNYYKDRG